jgi:hypothetical protein
MSPNLPALRPDGQPDAAISQIAKSESGVKSGLGTLLLNAQRVKPMIAVYASQASLYLNQADLTFQCDSRRAEEQFVRLLERLGYQFDFVSYDQVKQGRLRQYKALVMPMVRALDDEEINQIRQFAEQGGCIIADIAPGEFDGHGAPRAAFPLDDIFGVAHAAAPQPIAAERAASGDRHEVACAGAVADAAVKPADSQGGKPGGVINGGQAGAEIWFRGGRSLLLNHSWPPYGSETDFDTAVADRVGETLGAAELPKEWSGLAEYGGGFAGEIVRLKYGAAELLAFLANPAEAPDTQKVKLKFDGKFQVYDLSKAEEVPEKGNVELKISRGQFALLSALPYEVAKIDITCPENVRAGTRLPVRIVIKPSKAAPGDHMVHISLLKNNAEIPYYQIDAACINGETATFIPLAIDEAIGEYELTVKDLLSGATQTARINIVEPANRQ